MSSTVERDIGTLLANSVAQGREIGEIKTMLETHGQAQVETRKIVDSHVTTLRVLKWGSTILVTLGGLLVAFYKDGK